jgi:hypothetical protein
MSNPIKNWFKNLFTPLDTSKAYEDFNQMHKTKTKEYLDKDCLGIIKLIEEKLYRQAKQENMSIHFKLDYRMSHNEMWYLSRLAKHVEETFQQKYSKEMPLNPEKLLSIKIQQSSDTAYIANTVTVHLKALE